MIVRTITVAVICLCVQMVYSQSSPHGALKQPCTDCHTTTSWKELAAPMKFNHASTGFVLQGAHANTQCLQCHSDKKFAGTSTDCYSCHKKDFSKAMMPDHQVGQLSHDCSSCHTLNSWRPSVFEHSKTNFQLTGAHASVECSSCHVNNRFKGLPGDCFQCHQKDFTSAKSPDHSRSQFSRDCLNCHTMSAWQPSTFNHAQTNFVLTGAHRTAECSSCHGNGSFKGIAQDCYSCHRKEFTDALKPNHVTGMFDHNCISCHNTNDWIPSTFDHTKTEFALQGAHSTTDCAKCHTNGTFKGTPRECYPCHQQDIANTLSPDHLKGQFSRECITCHTLSAWKPSTFDHAKTSYPLIGAHKNAGCAQCHVNEQYKSLAADCYSCHSREYAVTEVPSHQTGQFSHDCLTCHSNFSWKPSTFSHIKTNFPLKGAHISVDCASCHSSGQFKGLSSDCFACHAAEFTAATNPNHAAGQFSHDCISCHSNLAWKPANFNHNASIFPLTGAHASVTCTACHKNGQYSGLQSDCYGCHQNSFNATTAPNHVTSQFSHDCLSCHTTSVWKPSTFNHAVTAFPLLGAHAAVSCVDCHKSGQYQGTPATCFACHQTDFNSVSDPNHLASNFDHNCAACHTQTGWTPATFNHNNTIFPLTGAHSSAACVSCHSGGKYTGTTTDCYTCHQSEYASTTNPAHATANYPKACLSCHTTTSWKPSSFNHTPFFPIGAGAKHRPGRWTTCADCHTNPSNYKDFSCIDCHEHNKTSMDNEHRGKAGYVYESQACYKCHPTGDD